MEPISNHAVLQVQDRELVFLLERVKVRLGLTFVFLDLFEL